MIVVSNDTDAYTLFLNHLPYFNNKDLKELWRQFGTSQRKSIIPLHDVCQILGQSFTKVILKTHVLTGDDTMSKIGSNKTALSNEDLVLNLSGFMNNKEIVDEEICQAEKRLDLVWSGTREVNAKTFDLLRVEHTCYSEGIHLLFTR